MLSLQNGVIKDDILRREFGEQAVMGGVGYVATHIARPGVIHQTGAIQRMVFGEYDGRRSARAEALLAAALKAGIQAELSGDIRSAIWEKYVFLVGLSGDDGDDAHARSARSARTRRRARSCSSS